MKLSVSHLIPVLILGGALIGSTACSPDEIEEKIVDANLLRSTLSRELRPQLADGHMVKLTAGQQGFALDLYRKLVGSEDGNIFFSPLSISQALSMTYAGARGETAVQMARVLNITLPDADHHRAMNALDQLLNSRKGEGDHGFVLRMVNAIWGQKNYPFLSGFLDILALHYGAGLRVLDFISDPERCRQAINNWVSDQTEEKIPELIAEGLIDSLTRLILTNAIYFKAAWAIPFDRDLTHNAPFSPPMGDCVSVSMMILPPGGGENGEMPQAYRGEGFRAIQLPYENNQLGMVLLLPDEGNYSFFEENLSAAILDEAISGLSPFSGRVLMPKFAAEGDFSLSDLLQALGMVDAFAGQADFTGIVSSRELSISEVLHKATITVDEAGTEAAAATAVIIRYTSVPEEIVVDRPFILLIRDFETGAILFMGRIMNPLQ